LTNLFKALENVINGILQHFISKVKNYQIFLTSNERKILKNNL